MLAAYPRAPARRPIGYYQARSPVDVVWRLTWPFIISAILACVMIIFFIIIVSLEIASLAKSTSKALYGNTSSTGAGFWCGIFFAIAAVLILMINLLRRTYLWALIALIGTIIAACFAIIIIGLDAKAVQDGHNNFVSFPSKSQVLAAQLAFSVMEFILCLVFIGIYIVVFILARRRLIRQRQGFVY